MPPPNTTTTATIDCTLSSENESTSLANTESNALEEFRSLVSKHSKTRDYCLNDATLIKFLRSRDYDIKESHKVLAGYLGILEDRPDIFSWNDAMKKATKSGVYYHYPILHESGAKILISHPGRWDTSSFKIESLISQTLFFDEVSLMDEKVQKTGLIGIIDMRGLGWSHIYNVGLSNAKLCSDLTDKFVPVKIINLHVVYENKLTDWAYSLFKPFLDDKIKQRIIFHGHSLESLYDYVPRSNLPPSLGGTNTEFTGDYYIELLEKHKDTVIDYWNSLKKKKVPEDI